MAAKNFTLYNYSTTSTATLNQITFQTPAGIQHIADLSAFGGYLSGASAFTGTGTFPFEPALYQSDTRPENAVYAAHYNTASNFFLIVDSTTRIQPSWVASGNGYTSGQSVLAVTSGTWLQMSAAPTFSPTIGQAILFSTGTIQLTVDSTTGISAGFVAVGNGYSIDQTVVSVVSGSVLQMSAYPNGTPSIGGTINFENRSPIGTLPPGGSIPFSIDHTTSLTSIGTYTAQVNIIGNINGPKTKVVRNAIVLSTVPVADPGNIFFDPGGGGGDGPSPPCSDDASVSCSAGGGGGGGKVICTALYDLGLMDKDIYEYDQAFGLWLYQNNPVAYKGYRMWADILVAYVKGQGRPLLPKLMFWKTKQQQQDMSQHIAVSVAQFVGSAFAKEIARRAGHNLPWTLRGWLTVSLGLTVCKGIGYIFAKTKKYKELSQS